MGQKLKLYHSLAPIKRHSPTVIFVHNMFGSARSPLRHQKWLNELGYNTVSFDLFGASTRTQLLSPKIFKGLYKGNFYLWKQHIQKVFESVSGPKIIYAFSGPALSALIAAGSRSDILKVICDGGPFSNIGANTQNLFEHNLNLPFEPVLKSVATLAAKAWGPAALNDLEATLKRWKPSRPILSIRGMKDPICPPETLERALKALPFTPQILEIPEGVHLDGLKNHADIYQPAVEKFLLSSET